MQQQIVTITKSLISPDFFFISIFRRSSIAIYSYILISIFLSTKILPSFHPLLDLEFTLSSFHSLLDLMFTLSSFHPLLELIFILPSFIRSYNHPSILNQILYSSFHPSILYQILYSSFHPSFHPLLDFIFILPFFHPSKHPVINLFGYPLPSTTLSKGNLEPSQIQRKTDELLCSSRLITDDVKILRR